MQENLLATFTDAALVIFSLCKCEYAWIGHGYPYINIYRVFYIGPLSCALLLIANLSFYSSSVLPMNPSLHSETRPHAVSVCVGVRVATSNGAQLRGPI
jgi:hypothetical protein